MKKYITIFVSLLALQMQAQRTLFDNGWKFTHEGKTISVDLPHDWAISYASDPTAKATNGTDGGWYPGGKGEYRKMFATRARW